jgi:hypothetical protein
VSPFAVLDAFGPYARLATAIAPLLVALIVRVIAGKSRMTGMLLSMSVLWFAVNVLAAPFSFRMQTELQGLRGWFR